MLRKSGKMIASATAVATMVAALAISASAASNPVKISRSAPVPVESTVIEGPALEGITWLQTSGAPVVSYTAEMAGVDVVGTENIMVMDRNCESAIVVTKADGVDADVAFVGESSSDDGTLVMAKADGVDADMAFAGEGSSDNGTLVVAKADGVDADMAFAGEGSFDNGALVVANADNMDAYIAFAGENSDSKGPIKVVSTENLDNVKIAATDGITLEQE